MTNSFGELIAEGTIRAVVLHANHQGLDPLLATAKKDRLKEIIKAGWDEMIGDLKKAHDAHMGSQTYTYIMNLYCNTWAVKLLKEVRNGKENHSNLSKLESIR